MSVFVCQEREPEVTLLLMHYGNRDMENGTCFLPTVLCQLQTPSFRHTLKVL